VAKRRVQFLRPRFADDFDAELAQVVQRRRVGRHHHYPAHAGSRRRSRQRVEGERQNEPGVPFVVGRVVQRTAQPRLARAGRFHGDDEVHGTSHVSIIAETPRQGVEGDGGDKTPTLPLLPVRLHERIRVGSSRYVLRRNLGRA
jgi:hypothetical protein